MTEASVPAGSVALGIQGSLEEQKLQQEDPLQEEEEERKRQQEKRERRRQERQRRRRQQQKSSGRPESVSVPPELLGAALERQHVDSIYAKIAPHFSNTRNRPWPRVAAFIESLPPDALLVDVGCGNGKYLHCRPNCSSSSSSPFSCLSIGLDRSLELLHCAMEHPQGALGPRLLQADCLHTCIRDEVADGVICIAVLHHLTTEARRQQALGELARITRPGGRILIYVWALEHEAGSVGERRFPSRDVLVPWVYQKHYERVRELPKTVETGAAASDAEGHAAASGSPASASTEREETFYRYYRVFSREDLLELCAKEKRVKVLDCYNDTNNWAVLLERYSD
ncbi:hypothetical protein, conserved [Eimeria brunetti]|uniref:Methyltransferase type 11 domain-containing protein n=1 Tax=Eimeria brunetti TaxID=51314 RepID=U6LFG5_9EIME|nr:hypothetical protein, conserved [Eimeria brunetti]